MIIFAGIDGTGDWLNSNYRRSFANSHVRKLSRGEGAGGSQAWIPEAFYHRGPRLFGNDTYIQAWKAYNYVIAKLKENPGAKLFLSGYSRGGAGVIEVAYWLKDAGHAVDAMFLFDAVDKSLPVGGLPRIPYDPRRWSLPFDPRYPLNPEKWIHPPGRPISGNVRQVYHARRHPQAKSRESFGNCGYLREDSSKTGYAEHYFLATHGGIGGMPWDSQSVPAGKQFIDEGWPDGPTTITPDADKHEAGQVWKWMLEKVRRECAKLSPVQATP